jgi:hypothetical protein
MPRYNPALIILNGAFAEEIHDRTQTFISERLRLSVPPPIFQFVHQRDAQCNVAEIVAAYSTALSKRSAAEAERVLQSAIDGSRIETIVVAPLDGESFKLAAQTAEIIDRCALDTVSGGRNAIFLVSRNLLSLDDRLHQEGARSLDLAMQSKAFPFNRCFFIDEVNELGQTITIKEDVIDLVANFIALTIASELSDALKHNPPPYDGTPGLHHKAYSSFSCNRIGFKKDGLIVGLSHHLAQDISQHLLINSLPDTKISGLLEQSLSWLRHDYLLSANELKTPRTGDGEGSNATGAAIDDRVVHAAHLAAQKRLDDLTDMVCKSLDFNLGALRDFLEQCLERWLTELEQLADTVKAKKAEIAELSVKAMLGIPRTITYQEEAYEKAKWWQFFGGGKRRPIVVMRTQTVQPIEVLRDALREYSVMSKVLDIHSALFARLDMACINLDLMKESLTPPPPQANSHSIFDLDLVDEELIEKFYRSAEYNNRDEDIKEFVRSDEFKKFKGELFSYPEGAPGRYLFDYCERRFHFITAYGVEKICRLKRSFKEHKEFLYLSTPFWKPLTNATGERLSILCCDERSRFDLNSVLDIRNSSTSDLYVESQDPGSITVIQISYGLKLQDVLLFTTEDGEPKTENADPGNHV